ncbi:MAG TPA: hypothetical protein DDZ67_08965 [Xanthomonadaceae bacterium]|nr:hypothetical protein [Xanthomonadaceae bacterium]
MDVNRLSSTSALISALRKEVVARSGAAGRPATTRETNASQAQGAPSTVQLRRQLVELARDVDLRDEAAVRQTRSRFVRTILLWEFGPGLREHPDWRGLMEGVEQSLDGAVAGGDPAFIQLLKSLQAKRR